MQVVRFTGFGSAIQNSDEDPRTPQTPLTPAFNKLDQIEIDKLEK